MSYAKKSPWVIHYDATSCNGCDIEVLATLCPGFDAERFGVINTGNPKHADIFLVTGSVNEQNRDVVKQIYDQMVEPKVVVACGICACTGGVFKDCYNVSGGVDTVIPVDVYVPGCAVRPESIIDAVVQGIEVLDRRSKDLKAGKTIKHNPINAAKSTTKKKSDAPKKTTTAKKPATAKKATAKKTTNSKITTKAVKKEGAND